MSPVPGPPQRLAAACSTASLQPARSPLWLPSDSNDTWLVDDARLGPVVLRVCWRGDVQRLARETLVVQRMPAGIRRPTVVGSGGFTLCGLPLTYSVTRHLSGAALDQRWPALSPVERRSAVTQLAGMLRELHGWTPPAKVGNLVSARPYLAAGGITELLGADLTPFPLDRVLTLARHAMDIPFVNPGLMSAGIDVLTDLAHLAPAVDDPARHGLMHGDMNLSNVFWTDTGALILLDFEWVRFGPPLLDIQRLCEHADNDTQRGSDMNPTALRWLAADYPELFQAPSARQRMRLYLLTQAIRHIIVDPPDRPGGDLPPDHAIHRIRRLVDGHWPAPGSLPDPLTAG